MTYENHFDIDMDSPQEEPPKVELIPLQDITFPEVIDNTILTSYAKCPRYSYWAHFQHLAPNRVSIHLHAGTAFASAMETYRKVWVAEGSHDKAQAEGLLTMIKEYGYNPEVEYDPDWQASAKSFEGMACAYIHATTNWNAESDRLQPLVVDGKPAVECSFAEILDVDHPITGQPLIYHGRFDMLGTFGGAIFVEDDKTTSALGPSWSGQWDMRSQFTGYCWGARSFGKAVAGAIVRGTAILKTKITHAEAIVYRPDWMVDEWHTDMIALIERMKESFRTGYFPKLGAFNDGCSAYGGCQFKTLCTSKDPEMWLGNYKRRVWNPTNPSDEGDE